MRRLFKRTMKNLKNRIKDLCNLYDASVIEDCSQAHGAMVRLGKVGNS